MRGTDPSWEAIVTAEVSPAVRMLVAMLHGQIHGLADLRQRGIWHWDPSEIGVWLKKQFDATEAGGKRGAGSYVWECAVREWQLWGRGTEVLCEVLERESGIVVDKARICRLAIDAAEGRWAATSTQSAEQRRKAREVRKKREWAARGRSGRLESFFSTAS